MGEEQTKGGFSLPWMNLTALVAAIAGGISVLVEPIISSRPPLKPNKPRSAIATQNVDARLWQDPLRAASEHADQASEEASRAVAAQAKASSDALRKRIREFATEGPEASGKLLVVPVLIAGGPYAEMAERRIRTRQAVVSALGERQFAPHDGERIGYFFLGDAPAKQPVPKLALAETAVGGHGAPAEEDHDFVVPFEQWREFLGKPAEQRPDGISEVIVLWVRDDAPDHRPLETLQKLGLQLAWKQRNIEVRILGPSSSAGLLQISKEIDEPGFKAETLAGAQCISAGATVATDLFNYWVGLNQEKQQLPVTSFEARLEKSIPGFTFERTIFRDDQLAQELVEELHRRNFQFPPKNPPGSYDHNEGAIALVSEWDTLYGRALPVTFAHEVGLKKDVTYADLEFGGRFPTPWLHRYFYLRWIDGRTPENHAEEDRGHDDPGKRSAGKEDQSDSRPADERTEGEDQSDYLRRLSTTLVAAHEQLIRDGQGGFKAIGVLGSDVYDKLMVLRALRKSFPGVLFFTTNLDARMLMREEWHACHNLIVASPFGLTLQPRLQGKIEPFRDGYQTALYAGMRHLLGSRLDPESVFPRGFFKKTSPRIFEIGRSGAFDLSCTTKDDGGLAAKVQPVRRDLAGWWMPAHTPTWWKAKRIWAGVGLGLALLGMLAVFRRTAARPATPDPIGSGVAAPLADGEMPTPSPEQPRRSVSQALPLLAGKSTIAVPAIVAVAGLTVWLTSRLGSETGESFALLEGLSSWPSMALQIVVGLLCLHFAVKARADLHTNLATIHKEFDLPKSLTEQKANRAGVWARFRRGLRWETSALGGPAEDRTVDVQTLWSEYLVRLSIPTRIARSLPLAILAFAGSYMLMFWAPPSLPPVRGHTAFKVMGFAFLTCTFLCTWLAFLCVDAIRLQRDFISLLSQHRTDWNAAAKLRSRRSPFLSGPALAEYLDIRLIGLRSEPVSRLIHYPFITSSLLVAALSSYFDDWSWPPGIIALYALNFACALFCAITLARSAEAARTVVLRRLRRERLEEIQRLEPLQPILTAPANSTLAYSMGSLQSLVFSAEPPARAGTQALAITTPRSAVQSRAAEHEPEWLKTRIDVYDQTIEEVEGMSKGALAPIWEQPFVRAILYSTGSLGLGSLLQFLPHW